jgi:hypothetical protein
MFVFNKIFNKPAQTRYVSHYRILDEPQMAHSANAGAFMVPSTDILESPGALRHFSITYDALPPPLYSADVGGPFEVQENSTEGSLKALDVSDAFERYLEENKEFQKLRQTVKNPHL